MSGIHKALWGRVRSDHLEGKKKNEVRNTTVMKEVLFLGFACFYLSNARDGTWGLACDRQVFQNSEFFF